MKNDAHKRKYNDSRVKLGKCRQEEDKNGRNKIVNSAWKWSLLFDLVDFESQRAFTGKQNSEYANR